MSAAINFRLKKPELEKKIKALEQSLDRDRTWIMNEAVEAYLETHDWQIERIQNGISQADSKKLVSKSKVDELLGKKK